MQSLSIMLERNLSSIFIILASLVCLPLSGCDFSEAKTAGKEKGAAKGRPMTLVNLKTVEKRRIHPRVIAVGSVTPRAQSIVASGANGIVTDFDVERGQFVRKGTILSKLRIKTADIEISEAKSVMHEREQKWNELKTSRKEDIVEAEARLRGTEAVRNNAAAKLKRTEELATQNAVNKDELDDAVERSKAAEAAYRAANANHDRVIAGPRQEKREQARFSYEAQKEHLAYLEMEKEKRTTLAPFDGYIVEQHSFVGMWLSKGAPIITLAYLDLVDVVVNVDQKDLHHILMGKNAEIRFPGHNLTQIRTRAGTTHVGIIRNETETSIELIASRDQTTGRLSQTVTISKNDISDRQHIPWTGQIVYVVPRSDWESGSRGFPVKVRIPNYFNTVQSPSAREFEKPTEHLIPILKEGMMAEVSFKGSPREALLVHKDALVRTTRGINIYIFLPKDGNPTEGKTIQVPVELGFSEADWIQVTPLPDATGDSFSLQGGMQVVTEGGERLQPVQDGIKAAGPPEETKQVEQKEKEKNPFEK